MNEGRYFKFLYAEDTRFMVGPAPTIKFGRLKYYRLLEIVTQDHKIGDVNEGVKDYYLNDVIIDHDKNDDLRQEFERLGFAKLAPDSILKIGKLESRSTIDCFVFSLGMGDIQPLADQFARSGQVAYNAALEVIDLSELQARIVAGILDDGTSVHQHFDVFAGPVIYGTIIQTDLAITRRAETPNPFFKDFLRYGQQCEYRIVLVPRNRPTDIDHVLVRINEGDPLFLECQLTATTGKKPATVDGTPQQFIATVRECFAEWEDRPKLKMDFDNPDWQRISQERYETDRLRFSPLAQKMAEAYWSIRHIHRAPEVDDAILSAFPPVMFNSRVALFANRLGAILWPPS